MNSIAQSSSAHQPTAGHDASGIDGRAPVLSTQINDNTTFNYDLESTSSSVDKPTYGITAWHSTWKRIGPLIGLVSLSLAFAGIFASLAVLTTSNRAPVKNWKFQPSAYFAIVNCTDIP